MVSQKQDLIKLDAIKTAIPKAINLQKSRKVNNVANEGVLISEGEPVL